MLDECDDGPKCPSCGRELHPFEDNTGRGYSCAGPDCMEIFDAAEIEEE